MKILIYSTENRIEKFVLHYLKQKLKCFIFTYRNEKDFLFKPDRVIVISNDKTDPLEVNKIRDLCVKNNIFSSNIILAKTNKTKLALNYKVNEDKNDFHQIIPEFIEDLIKKIKTEKSFCSKLRIVNESSHKKVHIYMPTYYRLEKTIKSINSIIDLMATSEHCMKLFIGDNNSKNKDMQQWLKEINKIGNVKVFFSNENIGKANMVNKLHHDNYSDDLDYVFSIDSDMQKPKDIDYNTLDKMIEILENCDNIGLVSSNQQECCHHWFNRTIKPLKMGKYNLGFTNNGIGIAGGCIVMKVSDWDLLGGYKKDHDIYTGDDSILTYNVERKLCKDPVVAIDYYMLHPEVKDDEEKGYQEWKNKSWSRDNVKFVDDKYKGSNKKGYWDV
jgi:hypothetical protein